jgi:hypothetical protein
VPDRNALWLQRVLKDELPTPEWKNQVWKDGIANIDEHLNGWGAGSKSIYATDIEKHVWAMNEVQRFFIEDTRLGIPVDSQTKVCGAWLFKSPPAFRQNLASETPGILNSFARSEGSQLVKREHWVTQTSTLQRSMYRAINAGAASKIHTVKIHISRQDLALRW